MIHSSSFVESLLPELSWVFFPPTKYTQQKYLNILLLFKSTTLSFELLFFLYE